MEIRTDRYVTEVDIGLFLGRLCNHVPDEMLFDLIRIIKDSYATEFLLECIVHYLKREK